MRTCAACGKPNIDDGLFCAHCGAELGESCAHCGSELPGSVTFCPSCGTAVDATVTEERRFVTVLFTDLVGFTAESDGADPEDVRARLTPYHQRVRKEIERYDGTVEKLIGDGVMAVFGVPLAHEDDPERAVRVALRIQAAVEELNDAQEGLGMAVRIGINSGEAIVTTGGRGERIVGHVVNTASRLESVAPAGGVVVGETTHRATRLLIEYEGMEPVEVKGKSKPLNVWRALEPRGRYGIDAAVRARTPFLGRESEMNLLTETFRRVIADGSLQLVTVAAAPGVGKSRLINEFWQWADDQPEVMWWRQGRCLPYGEGITFWALGEVVKGQAAIRESDDPEVAQEKLATALEALTPDSSDRDWLAAQLGPLVGTAVAVDYHVMVEPAQGDQVVRVVAAAVGSVADVMRLEPVAALTAIGGTRPVPPQHESAQPGRYRVGGGAVSDRLVVLDHGDLDSAFTADTIQCFRSHPRTAGDLDSRFAPGGRSRGGVDEDGYQGR